MAIKLIVTDMDGTLLAGDHATVPARNVAALQAAREKGVKVALATGRTWSNIRQSAEQLGGLDYAILANGASIREVQSGERIYENAFPNPQALALIEALLREELPFEIYCRNQNYLRPQDMEILAERYLPPSFAKMYLKRGVKLAPDLAAALEGRPMEKINLFYAPPERREHLKAIARATGPVEISSAISSNMEFNYGGVSKAVALAALAEQLGLEPGEVMAFGDANNDLAMLRWAGWSFAMANAAEEVKVVAKYHTASNEEAGVGQAVEKFVLGQ